MSLLYPYGFLTPTPTSGQILLVDSGIIPANSDEVDIVIPSGSPDLLYVEMQLIEIDVDGDDIGVRFSADGGSTFRSGAGNYRHQGNSQSETGGGGGNDSNSTTQILLNHTAGVDVGGFVNGGFLVYGHNSTRDFTTIFSETEYPESTGILTTIWTGGGDLIVTPEINNAIRIFPSSGKLDFGRVRLWGYQDSL